MGVATALALGAVAIGSGISAYGQYQQGKQMQAAEEYNARVAEQEAGLIDQSAAMDQTRLARAKARMIGSQHAAYAASGVVINQGSPLQAEIDTTAEYAMDSMIISWNAENAKAAKLSEAAYRRTVGSNYYSAGKIGAFSTILNTAGQVGLTTKFGGTSPAKTPGSTK